jgi:hypothetical protein
MGMSMLLLIVATSALTASQHFHTMGCWVHMIDPFETLPGVRDFTLARDLLCHEPRQY